MKRSIGVWCGLVLVAISGCVTTIQPASESTSVPSSVPTATREVSDATMENAFPTVLSAELTPQGNGTFALAVTISSPYDTPQRYADGWRVLAPDGTTLGEHTLLHDHANEQPFTRTQRGLVIPSDVLTVTVEGRDLLNGYGGATVTVAVESGD